MERRVGELRLTLTKANFTTWFKNTFIASFDDGKAIVCVPNTFTKAWLEKKYHDSIVRALRNITSQNVRELHYRVEVKNTTPVPQLIQDVVEYGAYPIVQHDDQQSQESRSEAGLNPRYGFDNFIVGKANELAHAAAMAVAAKPGTTYNPLFIYGGSGLGKTHLLHAVGRHVQRAFPDKKVLYVTSERFTNEFIQAVRGGRINSFKETYRNADVLMVDDIQFFSGKEETQNEFFHTFNELHQS